MHVSDLELGMLGANGIVAGSIPIAVGAAFANRYRKNDLVTVCFFGDGASNEGAFHEAANMAALYRLPVVFVCENNLYGEFTAQARHQAVTDIADRAAGYGMPGVGRRRHGRAGRLRRRRRVHRAGPRRRRAEPARVQDVPVLRPRRRHRHAHPVPGGGGGRRLEGAGPDHGARAAPGVDAACSMPTPPLPCTSAVLDEIAERDHVRRGERAARRRHADRRRLLQPDRHRSARDDRHR